MEKLSQMTLLSALVPFVLMVLAALLAQVLSSPVARHWRVFQSLSVVALGGACVSALVAPNASLGAGPLRLSALGLTLAVLVQLLGTVIGSFSARYLQGETDQRRYVVALAAVLAGVHLLLLADHWLLLIAAWAAVGMALQHLLCFYGERPFARLAAHKKRIADRAADALLLIAAATAWSTVGSGSLSALWTHIERDGMSMALQVSATLLVLAVVLRTALFPVHGWLIQVMEAPTPVSALLHAGVINLGGFVLIRFAPLLEQAPFARGLLLVMGLATAMLAGMVMLTRVSIKVRLAWSTVAQMGFMLLECAVGLYTLAALHLIGHSLYKAHAFLSASSAVRDTRLQALGARAKPLPLTVMVAPALTIPGVLLLVSVSSGSLAWPWWWSATLGLAWAPLLWLPAGATSVATRLQQILVGAIMATVLTLAALAAHAIPFGLTDHPHHGLGRVALAGACLLYLGLALLQLRPHLISRWRRWSYAGFYLDEAYTRLALRLWPTRWATQFAEQTRPHDSAALTDNPR